MRRILFMFLPLLFLAGCGSSVRVYHDEDPSGNFESYRTYSFLDWSEGNKKTISEIELERIRTAVARGLEQIGFEYEENGGDIKVQITVYFREARDVSYGYYPGSYNYIERALTLDIFETATKKHIWHAAAVGEVGRTAEERADELPEQVQKILSTYPGNNDT